jgi:GSH-dependent disulfide-bond oxidoreductase
MITLYTWGTPNGRKASIMLEETGLPYRVQPVNIGAQEQFDPAYLAINPNNKIPAIVDETGDGERQMVFETGAILIHLAEKAGKLLAPGGPRRAEQLAWLFWGSAGLAPMLGQWNYFARRAPEPIPAATARFEDEAVRLLKVLEKRLSEAEHLAGDYSIADIGAFTWTNALIAPLQERTEKLGPTPSIDRWLAAINARPAVQRGLKVPEV